MPKRAFALLFLLMLLVGSVAHAGDIPESIMAGQHKAMLIGQISAINADAVTIEPLTVMMGDAGSGPVTVKRFDSYSIYPHNPGKGDFIVALLLDDQTIDESWVFECSSADYKTLKIVHCNDVDMVQRYQQYINEGTYFEAQKKLGSASKDPDATASPIPTAGEETAQPTVTPDPSIAAAQGQPGSEDGTNPDGAIAAIVDQASGGTSGQEPKNRELIMLAVVLGVLAIGGGFALLHRLVEKRATTK